MRRVQQTQKGVPTLAASSSVRRARALGAFSRTTWLTQSASSFKRLVDSRYASALAAASSSTGLSLKSAASASSIALVGELMVDVGELAITYEVEDSSGGTRDEQVFRPFVF